MRRLGLRARLALLSATAVALAIAAVSGLAWWTTAQAMRSQVDNALLSGPLANRISQLGQAQGVARETRREEVCRAIAGISIDLPSRLSEAEVVQTDGTTCTLDEGPQVTATAADLAAISGGTPNGPRDAVTSAGVHVRAITYPVGEDYGVMIWRDLTELDTTLRRLSLTLLLAGGLGALGALVAGWAVARAGLRPLDSLTGVAERIAATQDLSVPITVTGADEVARLGTAFNEMTSALRAARLRQGQLIADAGHELRTPLTSLRTNIELLVRSEHQARALAPGDRRDLLRSLAAQVQELSRLTGELSLLAHEEPRPEPEPTRLDEVAARAVDRAGPRGNHTIVADLEPWTVVGDPAALERAVLNLLDNAIKFSPAGSTVRVRLRGGLLEVTDQGAGIPAPEQAHVFQRFWRSPAARSMSGSGLGLAIVAEVAAAHGGDVGAGNTPQGGAVVWIRIPGSPVGALAH